MIRVDSTSLIPGKLVCGDRGLGVLGSTIRLTTATGDNGPGLIYPSLVGTTDDADSFRILITSAPASGTFFVEETGAFSLLDPANGKWYITGDLYKNGSNLGAITFPVEVGLSRLEKNSTASYAVRSQLSKSSGLQYSVKAQLSKSFSITYVVRNRLEKTSSIDYVIEAGNGFLQKSSTLQYAVRANLQKTSEVTYQIRDASLVRLQKTASLIYSVIGAMPINYITIVLKENSAITIVLRQ